MESKLDPFSTIAYYYRVNADTLRRSYKQHSSSFNQWEQAAHAREYLLYPENITARLAIDEVSLSKGELYTILSSRDRPGRKGKLIAIIASTKAEDILKVLLKVPLSKRKQVSEISMDMAPSMAKACREGFPNALQVIDRFHVVKLVMEAMQHVRIAQRWKEIDLENAEIKKARLSNKHYRPKTLVNGDTCKQLLARARYLLYKRPEQWTQTQVVRAALLFQLYPNIEQAYRHSWEFRRIYELTSKEKATEQMKEWVQGIKNGGLEQFNSAAQSVQNHWKSILNFFNHRSTNAHAESFNAQIKLFRANLRGVTNVSLFLFRMEKIFA